MVLYRLETFRLLETHSLLSAQDPRRGYNSRGSSFREVWKKCCWSSSVFVRRSFGEKLLRGRCCVGFEIFCTALLVGFIQVCERKLDNKNLEKCSVAHRVMTPFYYIIMETCASVVAWWYLLYKSQIMQRLTRCHNLTWNSSRQNIIHIGRRVLNRGVKT